MIPLRRTRAARPLVAGLAALLLVSACTGEQGSRDDGPAPGATTAGTTPSASPSPVRVPPPPPPPPPPRDTACYRLSSTQLTRPTDASRSVPCASRHTARTIYVGTLHRVRGRAVPVGSEAAQRQLARTCPRAFASYVGGSTETRELSRLNVVWFSPTFAQAARGARWFRCDVVAFGRGDRLLPLPRRKGVLAGALDSADGLETFGLCGTDAPGSRGFERVACRLRHSWRAVATIPLSGGKRYPGTASVRKAGDDDCKDQARSRAADTLKFSYGWEWPTADQWAAGQHYGYCWVPA